MPGAPPPLAQPSFFTGPNDNLAVANAYQQAGGIVNAVQDLVSNLGISIPDVLKGGKALASLLPIVTGIRNGSLLTSPTSLITRLLASSTQITSAFKFLGPDMQADLLAGLKSIGPVAVTLGNLTQQIKVTNFDNLNSVGSLISAFTNGAAGLNIIDKDSIASVIGGIVKQAGSYGMMGTYGAVITGINDAEILAKAAGLSLPSVIKSGDAISLAQMAQSVSSGALTLMNPSALNQFASAFDRLTNAGGDAVNAAMYDTKTFSQIVQTFGDVNSAWNTCTRGNSQFTNITALMGASDDFSSMISNGVKRLNNGDPQQDYALAALYGPQDVAANIAAMFPNVVQTQSSNSVKVTGTVSPQAGAVMDALNASMPGLSLTPSTSIQDTTAAYYSTQRAIKNATLTQAATTGAPVTTLLSPTSPGSGSSTSSSVATVMDAFGHQIPRGTHVLLGYNDNGNPVYADDPVIPSGTLWSTPN